jgi:hypothetical protein
MESMILNIYKLCQPLETSMHENTELSRHELSQHLKDHCSKEQHEF